MSWDRNCRGLYQLAQKWKELAILLTDLQMELGRDTWKEMA